jgi:ubiquinone/menaquinone biosynthesis C-methylase UbiE
MSELSKALANLERRKIISISSYRKSKRTAFDIPVYSPGEGDKGKLDIHPLLAGVTSERIVEYDFVARCIIPRGKNVNILDVGSTGSGLAKIIEKFGRGRWLVVGIDLAEDGCDVRMDARCSAFRDGAFDQVICISTIEHVGRSCGINDEKGDTKVMREISRILEKGGSAVVTLPFGSKVATERSHRVYNTQTLAKLVCSFSVAKKEFYRYTTRKWVKCSQYAAEKNIENIPPYFHSGACACLLLKKKHPPTRILKSSSKANQKRK